MPYDKTLDLLEQIVTEYIQQVCLKALAVGKPGRILLEDGMFVSCTTIDEIFSVK